MVAFRGDHSRNVLRAVSDDRTALPNLVMGRDSSSRSGVRPNAYRN